MNVREFFQKFPDDDTCLEHVMKVRYGLEHECEKCEKVSKFYRVTKRPAYACANCGHHIYPCAGTPMYRTRTPLQMWFYAIFLFTTTRHGVSAKELQRQIGVTYKTAWRMGHEIRKYMAETDGNPPLGGHVEIDETYVGGRARGPKVRRWGRNETQRTNPPQTPVFGIVERKGKLQTTVIPNAHKATLLPIIKQTLIPGTRISTDQLRAYSRLSDEGYRHKSVDHSRATSKRTATPTQTRWKAFGAISNAQSGAPIGRSREST